MAGVLSTTKAIFSSTQQSGSVGSALSTFTRFKICFTSTPLTCKNGQVNKISLIQFNAHRNWYTVNKFNSKFFVKYVKGGVEFSVTGNLTHKDYGSIGDVATEFATQLKVALDAAQGGAGFGAVANQVPVAGQRTGQTGKRSFSCDMTSAATLTLSSIRVQFPQFRDSADETDFNDSYVLLGGKRISDSTDTTTSSIKVTIAGNKVSFQAPFPMVLQTQPYMYLSLNVSNDNLQTANLGNINAAIDEHVTSSCFLGKIPIQNEYCAIQLDESTPYFMTTSQRTVTELLFQCLDGHGRAFPFIDDVGDGDNIETEGNLFSDMIIRHEVLDIGSDGNVLDAPFKTYNYQLNTVGQPQLIGGGGF
jgi:hypothetical protein